MRNLVASLLSASLMPLNSTMIAVAVPAVSADFHDAPGTVTQAVVATYLVAAIALQSPGGKLGDRLGHRRVFTLGQLMIGVGAVLGSLAPTLLVLSVSRVLVAAGGAVLVPASVALIRSDLPPERRGRAFGTFGAVMSLAAAIGPLLGGELVDLFGWRSIFLANLPVLAVSAVLAKSVERGVVPVRPVPFDWIGSVLLTAVLSCLVVGAQTSGISCALLVAAGVVLAAPFCWWERKAPEAVIDFSLFRNVAFTAGTLLIALLNLVMYALLFEIPLILKDVLGFGSARAGRVLIYLMLATVVTSLAAGRLADRFPPRWLGLAGAAGSVVGIAVLLHAGVHSADGIRTGLALLGVGMGLATPAAQSASLSVAAQDRAGMAAGVSSTMRYLGGVAGVAILGRAVDVTGSPAAVGREHHHVLLIFVAALVVAAACGALLPGRPTHSPPVAALPAAGVDDSVPR